MFKMPEIVPALDSLVATILYIKTNPDTCYFLTKCFFLFALVLLHSLYC